MSKLRGAKTSCLFLKYGEMKQIQGVDGLRCADVFVPLHDTIIAEHMFDVKEMLHFRDNIFQNPSVSPEKSIQSLK